MAMSLCANSGHPDFHSPAVGLNRMPTFYLAPRGEQKGAVLIVMRVAHDPCSRVSPDSNQYAFALLISANGVRARISRSNNSDQFSM